MLAGELIGRKVWFWRLHMTVVLAAAAATALTRYRPGERVQVTPLAAINGEYNRGEGGEISREENG